MDMKKIVVTTKDQQTLTILATLTSEREGRGQHTPDEFHIMAFLGEPQKENTIISCNCEYMRKEYYARNPFLYLDSISAFMGETALQMFVDRKWHKGHMLFVTGYPDDCTVNENILFSDGFDFATLLRGMLAAVGCHYKETKGVPEYFIYCCDMDENPADSEWDRLLNAAGSTRYSCEGSDLLEEYCFIHVFTR